MDKQRVSDGGRIDNILEVNINQRGHLVVGDLGLKPREPYRTSSWGIVKTITNLLTRLNNSAVYLVPMGQQEYFDYKYPKR